MFEEKGLDLTGETFIWTLGGLAGGGPMVPRGNGFMCREKRFGASHFPPYVVCVRIFCSCGSEIRIPSAPARP